MMKRLQNLFGSPSKDPFEVQHQLRMRLVLSGVIAIGVITVALTLVRRSAVTWIFLVIALLLTVLTGWFAYRLFSGMLKWEQLLSSQLASQKESLTQETIDRTSDLERRLVQIRTAAEISRAISGLLDPRVLLQQVVDLILERFDLYYVGVFLLDDKGDNAILQAGTGESGKRMIADGHRLATSGSSMIGSAIANQQARIALDVGQEAVRFNNPHLPLTRSEIALPLISGGKVIGAITIQSSQPNAFDQYDITVLQGIADTLATALENARLFQQIQANLEEIRGLHGQYLSKAWQEMAGTNSQLQFTYEEKTQAASTEPLPATRLPITLRDQVIGQITFESEKNDWSPEELSFIEAVTTETAIALESARLLNETQSRVEQERLMTEITSKLRASSDIEVVLRTAIGELGKSLRASDGLIFLQNMPEEAPNSDQNTGDSQEKTL